MMAVESQCGLRASQSSFMVYIYHRNHLIAILQLAFYHVHTSKLIEVSTIIWVKMPLTLAFSEV